jgi:ParB family transcriptional regulator, chromosome partitioning protein
MKAKINEISVSTNYRIDPGSQEELKQSLQTHGMMHPIVVKGLIRGDRPRTRYELIAGYRRLKAAEALGWTEVPITVLQPKDTLDQFDLSMDENMKRKDFNPLEISELLFQRKRLWEQIHGPIKNGRPTEEEKLLPIGKSFFEEASTIFKRPVNDIYRHLQLHGMDEDLKKQVESGEMYYRKALEEQTRRNNVEPKAGKKKPKRGVHLPEVPKDILELTRDVQNVVWQLGGLNQVMRMLDGIDYSLDALAEDHIVEIIATCATLMEDIAKFNVKLQDTLLQKTGMSLENQ